MKIKTITCHDVYNAGASLQAYALVTYLRELGHKAEIINYKPDYLSRHYRLWGGVNPKYDVPFLREAYCMAKLPTRLAARFSKNKKAFDDFTLKYLPLTKPYTSNEALKKDPPAADVYFAGSDQIWNTLFPNGKDPAFYLDFVPKNKIRASYAASFATEKIDPAWKEQIRTWLSSFDYISVREKSGVSLLHDLGISQCLQVLDPVFLLSVEHWSSLIEHDTLTEYSNPFIFIYDFDGNEKLEKDAKRLAREFGCKIVSFFQCDYANICIPVKSPQMFLYLIYHAKFILSNSFHATAFSLIFQRQFMAYCRVEDTNSRIFDLLKLTGLEQRTCADQKIDWFCVQSNLIPLIRTSKQYLQDILGWKK